jgi:hypothetical protein
MERKVFSLDESSFALSGVAAAATEDILGKIAYRIYNVKSLFRTSSGGKGKIPERLRPAFSQSRHRGMPIPDEIVVAKSTGGSQKTAE